MSWSLCDADWNHWPDGFGDDAVWPAVAAGGFAGVEVGVYDAAVELAPERRAARARLSAAYQLPVAAILLSLPAPRWPAGALNGDVPRLVSQVRACARACRELGLDTLGIWPGADTGPWQSCVDGLRQVRDEAGDVRVAVEYKPDTAVATAADALALAAAVPGTGVLLDTGHAHAAGEDPAEVVAALGDLLWHVHLGDAALGAEDDDLPLGRLHDVTPLVAALGGYRGAATLDLYGAVSSGMLTGVSAGQESLAALRAAGVSSGPPR